MLLKLFSKTITSISLILNNLLVNHKMKRCHFLFSKYTLCLSSAQKVQLSFPRTTNTLLVAQIRNNTRFVTNSYQIKKLIVRLK